MKEEQLNQIRESCIKANPEIVELKFGCRFIDRESTQTLMYLSQSKSSGATYAYSETLGDDCYLEDFRFEDPNKIEILGRPIRLADVLLALHNFVGGIECYPQSDSSLLIQSFNEPKSSGKWNLSKDDLTLQSEEILSFLANLLK